MTLARSLFGLVLVLAASGCLVLAEPTYVCDTSKDCDADQVCLSGECAAKGSCRFNADCPSDQQVCMNRKCTDVECTDNDQCGSYTCDLQSFVCNTQCVGDYDCAVYNLCDDDAHCVPVECSNDGECNGYTCVLGKCSTHCSVDDCAQGYMCTGGLCLLGASGTCTDDAECASHNCCSYASGNRYCSDEPTCPASFANCTGGSICTDTSSCLSAPLRTDGAKLCGNACESATDCGATETCVTTACGKSSCPGVCWPICGTDDGACTTMLGAGYVCGAGTTRDDQSSSMCVPTCTSKTDCAIGACTGGRCQAAADGETCLVASDCQSRHCADGKCSTALADGQECRSDAECKSSTCCPGLGGNSYGRCGAKNKCPGGLGSPCLAGYDCFSSLYCTADSFGAGWCTRGCVDDTDCEGDYALPSLCILGADDTMRCFRACETGQECIDALGADYGCFDDAGGGAPARLICST